MKIKETPTALAILVFSWLIAIFGILIGSYIIIFKFSEFNSLIKGFFVLLGSLLSAAVIRMFANIGQILFDLKGNMVDNQKIFISSSRDLQDIKKGLIFLSQNTRETREVLNQAVIKLNQSLSGELAQNAKETKETIIRLNQSLSGELQAINQGLTATSELHKAFSNSFGELKNVLEEINCDSEDISQNIYQVKNSFEELRNILEKINSGSEGISQNTYQMKNFLDTQTNSLEQISCDSKDTGQNIHLIKTFFEQIERRLDLKK